MYITIVYLRTEGWEGFGLTPSQSISIVGHIWACIGDIGFILKVLEPDKYIVPDQGVLNDINRSLGFLCCELLRAPLLEPHTLRRVVERVRLPLVDLVVGGDLGVEAGAGRGTGTLDVHNVPGVELLDLEVDVGEWGAPLVVQDPGTQPPDLDTQTHQEDKQKDDDRGQHHDDDVFHGGEGEGAPGGPVPHHRTVAPNAADTRASLFIVMQSWITAVHATTVTAAHTGGLVPQTTLVQAGLSAEDVAALTAADVGAIVLVWTTVLRCQLTRTATLCKQQNMSKNCNCREEGGAKSLNLLFFMRFHFD